MMTLNSAIPSLGATFEIITTGNPLTDIGRHDRVTPANAGKRRAGLWAISE